MAPPMHFSEHSSEITRELGNRLVAQFKLAALMGVPEERIGDWCEKYASLFAEIQQQDPDLSGRINSGEVTAADLSWIRDQMGNYDTGAEDHDSEREPD